MLRLFNMLRRIPRFIPVTIMLLSVITSSVVTIAFSNPASAATTFAGETDKKTKLESVVYWNALVSCSKDFDEEITGDQIDKGPRWWVEGNGAVVSLGIVVDKWGNKDGVSHCNGENDDSSGYVGAALERFGVDLSDGKRALESLGYSCAVSNNEMKCKNPDARNNSSANGWLQKIKKMGYIGSSDLTLSNDLDTKNSLLYFQNFQVLQLTQGCSAKKGGNTNLVNISVVTETGTIKSEQWGLGVSIYTTIKGPYADPSIVGGERSFTCSQIATNMSLTASTFQKSAAEEACSQFSGVTDAQMQYFVPGCVVGWSNKIDPMVCVNKQFNNNDTINNSMRNACFRGQGQGTDANGKAAGTLCMELGLGTATTINGCIKGAENSDDPNYCLTAYPVPEQFPNRPTPNDTNKTIREACLEGQTLKVTVDGENPIFNDGTVTPEEQGTTATSCVVEGIGWMVCPLINAIGGVSDAIYNWIEGILLLNPLEMEDLSGNSTPQYEGWKRIRDISNVLLVIAFLIVIFSQITSIGVSNYGIKKLLPRVILVAILVNVSFIIMMFAIDAVNLIGKSLYDILIGLAPNVTSTTINSGNAVGSLVTGVLTGSLAGTGVVIAGGLIGAPALALIAVPFIVVAFLSLFAAIATLFIRNALVIVLVLVAPLAFAAFLLPNTKSLFDRWRKLLVGVLFLYPTAALLFGGTKFAAYTLANDTQPLSILMAVFVMAAPLGLLPWLAASSGGILGTIGGKLQGMARSAKAPLQNALKSRVENQRERYKSGQNTLFGRRRSQSEFDQRQIDTATGARKRNWGERLNQARTARDADTANAKTAQQANVAERGLRGTSRRDRYMGDVQREGVRQADQKAAQGADYRQQVDRMVATPGTIDAQRQATKFDAEKASEGYNATTKLRNEQRVIDNVASTATGAATNLGDQSTATFGTNEKIKAAEGEILTINQNSGVANDAIQQQKVNEQAQGQFSAERQEDFDESIVTDPTLMNVALDTERAKLGSAVAQGEVGVRVAQNKGLGGSMFGEEMKRRALDKKASVSTKRTDQIEREAGTQSDAKYLNFVGSENRDMFQTSQQKLDIIRDATSSADRVAQQEYAETLIAKPSVAEAAGGIDRFGASRVTAAATAQIREARTKAVGAEFELFNDMAVKKGLSSRDFVETISTGLIPGTTTPANPEQVQAAIQYVFQKGTVDQQMQMLDLLEDGEYHAFTPDPSNPAKGTVGASTGRPVEPEILQALSGYVSASKLQSVGGTQKAELQAGKGIKGYSSQIKATVDGGKFKKEILAGMDFDELTRFEQMATSGALGSKTDPDPTVIEHLKGVRKAIEDAKADDDVNAHFGEREYKLLDSILTAMPE